eukprot:GHUV01026247.1.p1 GENE.GHUV01026247.1~~GHUV01026247.1.p1  ORF type:complete len:129 (-),score=19.38 GHUV01026247.1:296-682(-)
MPASKPTSISENKITITQGQFLQQLHEIMTATVVAELCAAQLPQLLLSMPAAAFYCCAQPSMTLPPLIAQLYSLGTHVNLDLHAFGQGPCLQSCMCYEVVRQCISCLCWHAQRSYQYPAELEATPCLV